MKKNYFILKLIVIIVIASICSIFLIRILSDKIGPIYLDIAEKEVRKLVILVINNSVNEEVINEIDSNELFSIVKNNNDEIVLIDYNSVNVNKYLALVVKKVSNNLDLIEKGKYSELSFVLEGYDDKLLNKGIIANIPFGSLMGLNLLSNVGPRIPVKFNLIKDVSGGIDTKINEYGINNAYMEVLVKVNVNVNINLLFLSKTVSIECSIPISMKIIQGNIPNFYTGGINSTFGYIEN